MIELSSSSHEEDFFANVSRDAEFAKRLFGELNHDLLGPPDNDKVIVLSNSNEEEEVHEETAADADGASSTATKSSTLATLTTDKDPGKMQDDNSDDLTLSQGTSKSSGGEDEASFP
jgi:hypothetical protein